MILDRHVYKSSDVVKRHIPISLITAVAQTGVVAFSFVPGYAKGFQVLGVRTYCSAKTSVVSGKVKVGGREAVAAVSFTAATEVAQSLSATAANVVGSVTDALTLEYTTDGTGALVNGFVVVTIRPLGLFGEGMK